MDQLMQLNETAAKLDNTMEQVCRRIEKYAFETMQDQKVKELPLNTNALEPGYNCKFFHLLQNQIKIFWARLTYPHF